jgi:hypothetical protein
MPVALQLTRVFLNLCGDLSNKLAALKPGDLWQDIDSPAAFQIYQDAP